ncbi:MAG: FecR domain-containing protein [Fidelibacterota bacterium]
MFRSSLKTVLLTGILLTSCWLYGAAKIAVTTKVIGKVDVDQLANPGYKALKAGMVLADGDRIRTGEKAYVSIIFIDDKSMLKIKEKTEVTVTGKRSARSIAKQVNIDSGTLRAQVSKQRKGDFIVQSSTSVASVKGTDFWFLSDPLTGDQVIGLEGLVGLTNLISGESVTVGQGFTGMSTLDGGIELNETDPNTIPEDPGEAGEKTSTILRIELENPDGEHKTLLIEIQ